MSVVSDPESSRARSTALQIYPGITWARSEGPGPNARIQYFNCRISGFMRTIHPFSEGFCLTRLRLICLPTYLAPSSVAGRAQRHFSLIAEILCRLLAPLLYVVGFSVASCRHPRLLRPLEREYYCLGYLTSPDLT
jgi:hypothetical protein